MSACLTQPPSLIIMETRTPKTPLKAIHKRAIKEERNTRRTLDELRANPEKSSLYRQKGKPKQRENKQQMNRDQAKDYIKGELENYLKAKGINTRRPFKCLNPEHTDNHPSMSFDIKRQKAHCFSCGADYDTLDLIGIDYSVTDPAEIFKKAYELYGITGSDPLRCSPIPAAPKAPPKPEPEEPEPDYTAFFEEAHKAIKETDYPQRRGLSSEIIIRFNLGNVKEWKHPKMPNATASPRLIIPTSPNSYLARDTRENIPDSQQGYKKLKVGSIRIFNPEALKASKPIFIVEGEIDAMSIVEVGGEAIATGSAGNTRALLTLLEAQKPSQPLIIAMDSDKAGEKAARELEEGIKALHIPFFRANPQGEHKDANERLQADRDGLRAAVEEAERAARDAAGAQIEAFKKNSTAENTSLEGDITLEEKNAQSSSRELTYPSPENPRPYAIKNYMEEYFLNDVDRFIKFKNRVTGFENLDKQCGGLYPGLYVIGAITSLGKTTFIHQIGDQLAAAGDHVLYFSLEQSRLEMLTKSLSRLTGKTDKTTAVSAIDIRGGKLKQAGKAIDEYYKISDRVNIVECNFNTDINFITRNVTDYIAANQGIKPVVIVDYLQIIPPAADTPFFRGDKDKIDGIVRALKKMQSENDLVVFVVSSINRANYLLPIDLESFKESGGIEYTADVVWGLQLQAVNDPIFEKDNNIKVKREKIKEAKKAIPRKIELICLKNRYGISSYSCGFLYTPQFDLFEIDKSYGQDETEAKRGRV